MDELLTEFLAETTESLAALDESLLRLESSPGDVATLGVVFRLIHTIKGTCGFLDLPRLEHVAHGAEDLLCALRDGEMQVSRGIITLVLAAVDRIKAIVAGITADGTEPNGDDAPLLAKLCAALAGKADTAAGPGTDNAVDPSRDIDTPALEDTSTAQAAQTIRVNVAAIESLMTLVSELVLTRNQLLQIARTDADSRFGAALQRLSHLTSDLQEGVMKTRMQPIRNAWSTFPRMVRDLAGELGKQITLVMRGEDTELDRHVLELIRGPLTHMVRNCADHGVESTATRARAGKPAGGTITLNSFHEGGTIVIEVGDDGGGLSTARIRDRAIAQSLVTPAELAGWSEQQLNRLIFLPGLSTASAVTAVSGRGVGMDVVQTNIECLGGTVDVRSTTGVGSTFTVRIPLTLAIISALVVDAGGQRFAIPQTCVVELVRVEPAGAQAEGRLSVERVDNTPVLRLRDKLLPLVSLAALMGLTPSSETEQPLTIVVAQLGGLLAGLLVDQVFDTEEIVVKPASRLLRNINVFSGNTILGDGSVIMIIDPNGLSKAIGQVSTTEIRQAADVPRPAAEHTGDHSAMLVVRLSVEAGLVAVPLGLVARIESIAQADIEFTPDRVITKYRGHLMPLVAPAGHPPEIDPMPVLVFSDRGRSVGLMVAQIVDVVEHQLAIELTSPRSGILGTALIAGHVTDVLDTGHWLTMGRDNWFSDRNRLGAPPTRLLVVDDSAFFRQLLVPALSASGFHVTAVDSAAKALALRDGADPASFDAIISDVEMPDMDGLQFARQLRQSGRWSQIPLVALSGRCDLDDQGRGRAAGFDEYVGKFDRDALLVALGRQIALPERQAA